MVEAVYQAPQISTEEYKKYRGKHVAIYKNKIIADGNNSVEALKKALEKYTPTSDLNKLNFTTSK